MRLSATTSAILLAAACGGGGAGTPANPASQSSSLVPDAPPPAKAGAAPYCVASDADAYLSSFAADHRYAVWCTILEEEGATPQCHGVELASGTFFRVSRPPPSRPDAETPYTIEQSDEGGRFCGKDGCVGPELPPEYGESCLESAYPVGDNVYVTMSVCAGPGGSGLLHDRAGKLIREVVDEGTMNVYGSVPIALGGDAYALVSFDGGDVVVFNGKTGKRIHHLEQPTDEECTGCWEVLGTSAYWREPPIVKRDAGDLVTIGIGGVSVIDPVRGTIEKTYPFPICPSPDDE